MGEGYIGTERRRHKRLEVNFTIIYRVDRPLEVRMMVGDKGVEALMLDLSEGGMCILTDYNIPIWTVLDIKFSLINLYVSSNERAKPMQITGEVRYNILTPDRIYRLGICFTDIDEKDKTAIIDFLNKTSHHKESQSL